MRTIEQAAELAAGIGAAARFQPSRRQSQSHGSRTESPYGPAFVTPILLCVQGTGVHVRSAPGLASQIIQTANWGDQFYSYDWNNKVRPIIDGYAWTEVHVGQKTTGYIASKYLAPCQPSQAMPQGGYTQAETYRRALMQQALPSVGGQRSWGGGGSYQVGKMGVHGVPGAEENMQSDLVSMAAGLGALFAGLAVPGPYGANPAQMVPSGTYEISGTAVAFRDAPGLGGAIIDTFNPDTSGGNSVVGTPDQVEFKGETGTGSGLTWAKVTAKGKTGFVAVEYMAPVGWTAQQGKVVPKGGGGIQPASQTTTGDETTATDYTPYILGGAAVLGGGIILWAVLAKPKGRRSRRHAHA